MVFLPMLAFHIPAVSMAASSTCTDWKSKPRPQMRGSMNPSVCWRRCHSCSLCWRSPEQSGHSVYCLQTCWSSCEYEEDWSPVDCCQPISVCTLLLCLRRCPVQGTYMSSHTWVVYWATAAAWIAKLSTELNLLHLPSADCLNVSFLITTLPYLLKWPSSGQSLSQLCCTAVNLYRRHIKAFEPFHIRSLQSILGIWWWQKIPHTELFEKAGIIPAEHLFLAKDNCVGWGMLSECLTTAASSAALQWAHCGTAFSLSPKETLYWPLQSKSAHVQHKPSELEAAASYRDTWRTVCDPSLRSLLTGWITAFEELRAARHAASSKPKTGPRCPQCVFVYQKRCQLSAEQYRTAKQYRTTTLSQVN